MPRHAGAVLGALHLDYPDLATLAQLSEPEWRDALDYADRERITLALRDAARDAMPEWARARVDRDAAKNRTRQQGIDETYRDLADWLDAESLQYVFLKGFTHPALFGLPAESRVQYDIDLWLPHDHALRAQRLLGSRGYEPMPGTEALPTDHLPALVRKTGWQWRNDFFDPEIPLAIELHVQFWNHEQERFSAPGTEDFWPRHTVRALKGRDLPVLHPADALAYAALHVLKHVLAGNVRIFHVFELAAMLQAQRNDPEFWAQWQQLHPPELRKLEALAFRLAQEWFGGARSIELPIASEVWFENFALSPATLAFRPNKDHVWLHLTLLQSPRDAWDVAIRRIFPRSLPAASGDSFVAAKDRAWRDWLRWRLHWIAHTARRAVHHLRALSAIAISGVRWWRVTRRLRH
jgi:hypothetical protein